MTDVVIPWGFRGDPFLLSAVHSIVQHADIRCFIETGAFHGTTIRHMAQSYPWLTCYSCEPHPDRYRQACAAVAR